MAWTNRKGFNFRETSGFVTDGTNETFDIGAAYPRSVTIDGDTFNVGWNVNKNMAGDCRDRSATPPSHTSGLIRHINAAAVDRWRLDLGDGPGDYSINFAAGDRIFGQTQHLRILDDATPLLTIAGVATGADQYLDGSATLRTSSADFEANATPVTLTFASSICYVEIGVTGSSSNNSTLAHFSIAKVGSSGHTVTVNQASETDTAQSIARNKAKAVGQVSETDTAQAVSKRKLKALAQTSETDTAQPIAWAPKRRLVGQATETDSAQPISRGAIVVAVGQVVETDAAQSITRRKLKAVGQVSETDSAQSIARSKAKAIGQVSETDTAQPITRPASGHVVNVGQAVETDTAQSIAWAPKRRLVAQAVETDAAQSIARRKQRAVGQVVETDAAQAFARRKVKTILQAVEVDEAQLITPLGTSTFSDPTPARYRYAAPGARLGNRVARGSQRLGLPIARD